MKKILITLLATLVLTPAASASVKLVHVTSPAYPGGTATLTATVTPNAACTITVNYYSGPSHASGLYPQHTVSGLYPQHTVNHRVSWTWNVGTRTYAGRWGIVVQCGRAGTLHTSFVVK